MTHASPERETDALLAEGIERDTSHYVESPAFAGAVRDGARIVPDREAAADVVAQPSVHPDSRLQRNGRRANDVEADLRLQRLRIQAGRQRQKRQERANRGSQRARALWSIQV